MNDGFLMGVLYTFTNLLEESQAVPGLKVSSDRNSQ
jgi:hypothetical protein